MTPSAPLSTHRYEGRRVLLTGGASGIGRATAVRLIDEGATVFAVDRDSTGLAGTAELVGDRDRFRTHVADLSQEDAVVAAAAAGITALGGVDVLVSLDPPRNLVWVAGR